MLEWVPRDSWSEVSSRGPGMATECNLNIISREGQDPENHPQAFSAFQVYTGVVSLFFCPWLIF